MAWKARTWEIWRERAFAPFCIGNSQSSNIGTKTWNHCLRWYLCDMFCYPVALARCASARHSLTAFRGLLSTASSASHTVPLGMCAVCFVCLHILNASMWIFVTRVRTRVFLTYSKIFVHAPKCKFSWKFKCEQRFFALHCIALHCSALIFRVGALR